MVSATHLTKVYIAETQGIFSNVRCFVPTKSGNFIRAVNHTQARKYRCVWTLSSKLHALFHDVYRVMIPPSTTVAEAPAIAGASDDEAVEPR